MTERSSHHHSGLSETEFRNLRRRFHDPVENYQRLRGESQGVKGRSGVWDTDFTNERYIAATDDLIGMMDGSITDRVEPDPTSPEHDAEKPDVIIWLDKSARPVSWLADAFWEQYAEGDAEKPAYDFLNIDRVNWFVKQGHSQIDAERRLGPTDFDIDKVRQEDIDRIRAYFTIGELSEDNWREEVWKLPTRLDDKNVLIIDEVRNKGGTLKIATELIRRAVPSAGVSGDYFWKTGSYSVTKTGSNADDQKMESAPVWYNPNTSAGRGIGEVSTEYYDHLYEVEPTQENLRKKLASFSLSAPHYDRDTYEEIRDPLAEQLRQDMMYLTYSNVLRTASPRRDVDQAYDIIEKQGLSPTEYREYRSQRSVRPKLKP